MDRTFYALARDERGRPVETLVRGPDRSAPGCEKSGERSLDEHVVSLLAPDSFEAEQYRTLSLLIEQRHTTGALTSLAVSSPAAGDGKTVTAINLAGTLAQAPEIRVLLICTDLRKPSLASHLGMDNAECPGLVEAIMNPGFALEDVVRPCDPFHLAVLPSGRCTATPYEALRSPRLGELMQEARRRYDYVILDAPPLVPVPDCRLIDKWVDGFLLVVAAHKTPRKLLADALSLLDPSKVIGLVFNRDNHVTSEYSGYYSGFGRLTNATGAIGVIHGGGC